MNEPRPDGIDPESTEAGIASMAIAATLIVASGIGMVVNILLAVHAGSILNKSDARLHGIGSALILIVGTWVLGSGFRLNFQARESLALAGRAMLILAGLMWLLFAIGQTFVLVPHL